ncbi:uncharacterized protein LOC127580793 isoform X3 [Pristis pectinata]|uniref:uncharacterized protein LOC127580793 isoform X3 n=1 Tax=Pristis pectinata TaxID=685728 RepID=UPI00223DEEBE|nr:uncharacterized protein LOC127580793 isoform X3 [Pristis pectinata]
MWRKSGHWPERRFKHDLHLSYLPRPRPVPTPQLPGIRDLTADIGLPQPSTSRRSMVQVCRIFQVSGALWAERDVRGVVGRAITIDCHYAATYRSHTKYWCDGWTHQCLIIVATNGQHGWRGRVSVTDDTARGIFTVTVEDLHSGDTGRYSCGISTFGNDPVFNVYLQVSDEPVSVPVLGFLSPANVSRLGGSVLMSCESVQGSLPIQYTWYEKTPSVDSKVSDTSKLDLHCQSFKHQHHQYYCTASNNRGTKSSEIVNVTVFNKGGICSYVTEINSTISGALWAKNKVRGVVGRAITINCHYAATYRSHSKYLCRVWGHQCTMLVETNGQHGWRGRRSITDNPARGIFTVTVEDLRSYDTGCYSCGITTPGDDPMFDIHLQVSDEPVSVPVLGFLSPANVSCVGGSVSCESVWGSLPIQYTWYEKMPSVDSKISDTNKLDLHCQSFKHQYHQYYCRAANIRGTKSSEIVNVSIYYRGGKCSYVMRLTGMVSGALWAERDVRGVVGRAITIDCHYTDWYRSHTKYWCDGWTRQCSTIVATNGQHGRRGRVSITDNPARGIFTVTVEDLHPGDAGRYSCGISTFGNDPMFNVDLQVSDEPVSVPVLGFLSPANVSRLGGSVSMSCESVQGSVPVQYAWYEKTPSRDVKIFDTSVLDLYCQSFELQHHQYYCTASNNRGEKSSEMVNVTVFKKGGICSYVTEVNGTISGAFWAKDRVIGVVGRTITIDCHYAAVYHSHTKYLCRVWGHQCIKLVETNGQSSQYGRRSITDNSTQGIFTVTMEDLHTEDTGWYRCGIKTLGLDPMFDIHLQVSDEPVSVPVLGFQSPANARCLGHSVTVSCESVYGSLPITYAWYEKMPSEDSKISNNTKLDLHCESLKGQYYQYYCTASNVNGTKSSEMVNVSISNSGTCRNVIEANSTGPMYFCDISVTESMTTAQRKQHTPFPIPTYIIVLSVLGILLIILVICLLCYLKWKNRVSKCNTSRSGGKNETQEMATLEGSIVYADLHQLRTNEAAAQLDNNENGIVYADVQFQRKSRVGHSITDEDNVTYADIKLQSHPRKPKQKGPSPGTLQDSAQAIYANVGS